MLYHNSVYCKKYSMENFQNYNDEELYSNRKIVASYYVNEHNITKIKDIINLIVKQNIRLNQFCLNVPERFKNFIDTSYIENNDIIKIFYIKRDFNECNGLIPTFLREKNGKAVFIVFGDDILNCLKDVNFLKNLLIRYHVEVGKKGYEVLISTCKRGTFITCVSNFNVGLVDNISSNNKELYNSESWYRKNINNNVRIIDFNKNV